MAGSLTLEGPTPRCYLSFFSGLGMLVASYLTIDHFFDANFPTSIWAGSFCDINAFFNCDSSAFSALAAVRGAPLGYFGIVVGGLVSLGALFPNPAFERTNKTISLVNAIGVIALAGYSVIHLGSLCLLCTGYYAFAIVSFLLFWRYGIDREAAYDPETFLLIHDEIFADFEAAKDPCTSTGFVPRRR